MEIIDKKHKEYDPQKLIKNGVPYIRFSRDMKKFYISYPAVYEFGVSAGMYWHFVLDVDRVYAFVNEDKSGILASQNKGGLIFTSAPILKILGSKNKLIVANSSFPLRKSAGKINGALTIEIMIHNRLKTK